MSDERNVAFMIGLKKGADAKQIKENLEQIANQLRVMDLEIHIIDSKTLGKTYINGLTSKRTYETIFMTTLRQVDRNINNINRGSHRVFEYVEMKPAHIPSALIHDVEYIRLPSKYHTHE